MALEIALLQFAIICALLKWLEATSFFFLIHYRVCLRN